MGQFEFFCSRHNGARGLYFVAAGLEDGLGAAKHLERVGDLLLVLRAVEIEEGRDGADLWFGG